VSEMGGRIMVSSMEGQGTTFTIIFPVEKDTKKYNHKGHEEKKN